MMTSLGHWDRAGSNINIPALKSRPPKYMPFHLLAAFIYDLIRCRFISRYRFAVRGSLTHAALGHSLRSGFKVHANIPHIKYIDHLIHSHE